MDISFSSDSDSWFSLDNHHASSSQHYGSTSPPTTTNLSWENVLVPKKRRGRPRGSKKILKPTSKSMEPQSIEPFAKIIKVDVTPGKDIIESITDVARQDHVSLTILNASGMITDVNIHTSPDSTALRLQGPFTLLSLTGTYIYKNHYTLHPGATPPPPLSFGINLCTSQGQVFGGPIVGTVVAGDNVSLMVSTFRNPGIYNYVPEDEVGDNDFNKKD